MASRRAVITCVGCGSVGACACPIPPLGWTKQPSGYACYVVVCAGCEAKLHASGLACICPHCGAWLEFTWPVPYNSVPLVGKQKVGKP
jgi:hypothetical protein